MPLSELIAKWESERTSRPKIPLTLTRFHYTDLECAALNGGADGKRIWEDFVARFEITIDEIPVPGKHYADMSVCFMYPSQISSKLILKEKGN